MKKQINPTIKAHLIRSAFYLLLLLAVCAIPFALAQRNAAKRNVAKPAASSNLAANAHLTPLSNLKPASNPRAGGPQATDATVRVKATTGCAACERSGSGDEALGRSL